MTLGRDVLLVGLEPSTVAGVDADLIETAIAIGDVRLRAAGFNADYCLVAVGDEAQIIEALLAKPYVCVVVGGGIRKPQRVVEFFERVINLIRVHAPQAAIAFNTTGENSVDAVSRCLPA